MILKKTYESSDIHTAWESTYRGGATVAKFDDQIMDRLLAYAMPRGNALFLDAGCGVGDHSFRIVRRGFRCVGTDISEYALRLARGEAWKQGLSARVSFVCQALEDLAFPDETFDVVHCRGVLMHIPDWDRALRNLCRVLKRGGKIIIMESNHRAIEMGIVLLVRKVMQRRSKMVETPGGLEFWSKEGDLPFLVRVANISCLAEQLRNYGVDPAKSLATSLFGVGRFPRGLLRNGVLWLNQLYFLLRLPSSLGIGNAIIGERRR
jgi:ubiquinone/menaquinone biosynthesis C-methylase UbiE